MASLQIVIVSFFSNCLILNVYVVAREKEIKIKNWLYQPEAKSIWTIFKLDKISDFTVTQMDLVPISVCTHTIWRVRYLKVLLTHL